MGSGLLSPSHLAVVLVIALIVFGPKRLPELGRALGSGMRGFKSALEGDDDRPEIDPAPPSPAPTAEEGFRPEASVATAVSPPAADPAPETFHPVASAPETFRPGPDAPFVPESAPPKDASGEVRDAGGAS